MMKRPKIICYGELLWDIFQNERKAGGAPMNVAYHFYKLGGESILLSRIGTDILGRELLQLLEGWGLNTDQIQVDEKNATSTVVAIEEANHEMRYNILYPVAWDFIESKDSHECILQKADALIFGTLGMRHPVSRSSLFSLIEGSKYNVFDVNLRPPYYNREHVIHGLERSNVLKVNEHELDEIAGWFDPKARTDGDRVDVLLNRFDMEEVLLTKGANGASYYSRVEQVHLPSYQITVADTVGSGDAFLAAYLIKEFSDKKSSPRGRLEFATLLGSFVASHFGACPPYTDKDIFEFKNTRL